MSSLFYIPFVPVEADDVVAFSFDIISTLTIRRFSSGVSLWSGLVRFGVTVPLFVYIIFIWYSMRQILQVCSSG